jgi:hypothetical protein
MTPNTVPQFFHVDRDLVDAMHRLKRARGVQLRTQINAALREWLNERADAWPLAGTEGVKKTERKRVATRRRS